MTQQNLTQILKVIRDLVMRNRPCYRDYLGNGQYETKILPEYLLPAFLQKNVVATKTEVKTAQTSANTAQNTANTAQNTADSATTIANNCVSFSVTQSLTDEQKTRARDNIGAISTANGAVGSSNLADNISYTKFGLSADQVRKMTFGTAEPSGGSDGDVYIRYS